jgi:hypothetical protein
MYRLALPTYSHFERWSIMKRTYVSGTICHLWVGWLIGISF